jgi:phenylpropionate dioxygenase-like ring-hydroxylating dioxygenase large terminal subunit
MSGSVAVASDDELAPVSAGRSNNVAALARGLPARWYPILRSSDLGDRPVRIRRFGEELAVWRDSAGRARVFQDRCPHRGASLAQGKINGDRLSCGYHGWTFDGEGTCVDVSMSESFADKGARLRCEAHLKTYPAQDRAGYIWAFYGDSARVTPLNIVPYELEDERWAVYCQEYVWKTNWMNILDNIFDPLHALFAHVGVFTQRRRAKLLRFEITKDFDEGFWLSKRGVLANGEIGEEAPVEFLLPAVFRIDLADGTPRGLLRVVMISTPIDEDSTFLCYIQARRVRGLKRLWFRILWQVKLRRAQDIIKQQDKTILEALGPIAESRRHEHLSLSDVGVSHLRRRLDKALARAQGTEALLAADTASSGRRPFADWELEAE